MLNLLGHGPPITKSHPNCPILHVRGVLRSHFECDITWKSLWEAYFILQAGLVKFSEAQPKFKEKT
jgi:hypothetical protein